MADVDNARNLSQGKDAQINVDRQHGSENGDEADDRNGQNGSLPVGGELGGCGKERGEGEGTAGSEGKSPSRWQFIVPSAQSNWRSIAKYCPLVAAILAPLSTLLDIPALSQHWYVLDGVAQPDPVACLSLSGLGLALNIFANCLLILRFSLRSPPHWRLATTWSLLFWLGKTVVAAINLAVFGIATRNTPDYSYAEGFWCAVISIIDSGIICITLLFHYFLAFDKHGEDTSEVRREGRRFMLSVTLFLGIVAIQALVFCKVEAWAYSDAIYFSVQTALTIGFGDFKPATTAGKVLVFPFSVLTISQLGNEIALIIGFISARAQERRSKWKGVYEKEMRQEAEGMRPGKGLLEEMALVHQINSREEMMSQMIDLMWSVLALVVFWVAGAGIFSSIEGWSYGNALYAVMILSLTIGFGDFTPVQPAGKVVFIVYALMAVPIVTSFAVQTITGLLSTYSDRGAMREAFLRSRRLEPEAFQPHADFILRAHETYSQMAKRLFGPQAGDLDEQVEAQAEANGNGDDSKTEEEPSPDVRDGKSSTKSSKGLSKLERDCRRVDEEAEEANEDDGMVETRAEERAEEYYARTKKVLDRRKHHHSRDDGRTQDQVKQDESEDDPAVAPQAGDDDANKPESDGISDDVEDSTATGKEDKDDAEELAAEEKDADELEAEVVKQLLECVVRLEAEARDMLLQSMSKSVARTLLLADRNVQVRDVKALLDDTADPLALWRGQHPDEIETDMLARVRKYRNTFAEILVLGAILRKLEGKERHQFERFRDVAEAEAQTELSEQGGEAATATGKGNRGTEKGVDLDELADRRFDGITQRMLWRATSRSWKRSKTWAGSEEKG